MQIIVQIHSKKFIHIQLEMEKAEKGTENCIRKAK